MVRTHMGASDASYGCVFQQEDEDGTTGLNLSLDSQVPNKCAPASCLQFLLQLRSCMSHDPSVIFLEIRWQGICKLVPYLGRVRINRDIWYENYYEGWPGRVLHRIWG